MVPAGAVPAELSKICTVPDAKVVFCKEFCSETEATWAEEAVAVTDTSAS